MNPGAPVKNVSRMSKWWPIGFFIGALVFFVIGGALVGTYLGNTSNCYNSYNTYYYDYSYSCSSGANGEFYGGLACFAIGGILKLVAWILLIVFCVKRRRSIQQHLPVQYYTGPPQGPVQQPYGAPVAYGPPQGSYPPPPQGAQYPSQPYPPQYPTRSAAASPSPMDPNAPYQAPAAPASPPPKEAMATTHYA